MSPVRVLAVGLLIALPRASHADQGEQFPYYPIPSSASLGVQTYLRMETSSLLYNVLYRWGQVKAAPSGAYGPNVSAPRTAWLLEYQRAGATDVIAGVLRRDSALIASGLHMFHFGLAREASNGSFPGSATPFHGTAMFLAEAASSLLVLKYSALTAQYSTELSWQEARMLQAARHLVKVVGGVGRIDDSTKNHRFFEAALALEAVGALTGQPGPEQWAKVYASKGMAMERANGVMPEDGGHDTGYQALGLTYATRYLTLVTGSPRHAALLQVIQKGERWELSRVRPDGTVNQSGDTRTAGCKERDATGHCKTTFYASIFNALARWSVVTGDQTFERAAYKVWLRNWASQPGDVLPPPGLHASPGTIAVGQWLTVSGAGFQPLESVKVYFGKTEEERIQADQTGSFGGHSAQPNAHFPVPSVSPGTYTIVARGSYGTVRHTHVTVTG